MEIIVQSIPEKNQVVEFHGPWSEIVSCVKSFKLERVLKVNQL